MAPVSATTTSIRARAARARGLAEAFEQLFRAFADIAASAAERADTGGENGAAVRRDVLGDGFPHQRRGGTPLFRGNSLQPSIVGRLEIQRRLVHAIYG